MLIMLNREDVPWLCSAEVVDDDTLLARTEHIPFTAAEQAVTGRGAARWDEATMRNSDSEI